MAAACLSIIRHWPFWRLYLCVHISHARSQKSHAYVKKQKVTWKVISASSQVTCAHVKRLKGDTDPQLCLPTKQGTSVHRNTMVMGGVLRIWNAIGPKPLLTIWSLWSLICFEPCNTRPAICNQATNTSMPLSFHINPTHYCVRIKLMCFGGTGAHRQRQAGEVLGG